MPQNDAVLCSDCAALDWRGFASSPWDSDFSLKRPPFGVRRAPMGRIVKDIKTPHEQLKASSCTICRMLSIIKDAAGDQEWFPGRFYDRHLEVGPLESQVRLSPSTDSLTDPALLWIGRWRNFEQRKGYSQGSKYIALFQSGYLAESCKIQPFIDDFSWMKNAIDDCQKHHSNCSKTKSTPIVPGLRVIDCQAGCSTPSIILAHGSCQYVALSYVWGGPAHVADDEVAPVIKDAMKVTLELGLRFLWVDRYCIPQDSEEKHRLIHAMDEIYSNALVTIIAAAGNSARDGLPGISNVPRVAQVEVEAGGCTFLEIPSIFDAVQASTWATRSWTYQEVCLSTRSLIFTERGALYCCADRVLDESTQRLVPDGLNVVHMRRTHFYDMLRTGTNSLIPSTSHLKIHIEQYTKRQLSYPQDSLNAFLGILRVYGRAYEPVEHFWGMPYRQGTLELEWYHQRPAVRRPDFPSWSWAGWAGGVEWHGPVTETECYSSPIFKPILVDTPTQSSSMDHPHWSFEQKKYINVTGAMLPLQFCTPEQTERVRSIANHLGLHSDADSSQARPSGPYAIFEFFPGIFGAIRSSPDSENDFRDDLVGLLATQADEKTFIIPNIIILKPLANHFERVGLLNMRNSPHYEYIYMDDSGAPVAKDQLPWGKRDIERPWLRKVERQRICLK